jgi:type I restriction enzyme S subunit
MLSKEWEVSGKEGKRPPKPKTPTVLESSDVTESEGLPTGWVNCKFKYLYEESQNGLSKRRGVEGVDVPVLRLADIVNQKITTSNLRQILLEESEIQKYHLECNDLVCIRVNGSPNLVGRMIIVESDDLMAYCDHFIRFKFDPKIISSAYLQSFFNTRDARRFVDLNKVSSAGQNRISQVTLGELIIPYCSPLEQQKIADKLDEEFSRIEATGKEIEDSLIKVEALRQSILKRAFSGRLVDQDPDDDHVSVLLERIKEENSAHEKGGKKRKKSEEVA